jgi:hypothetical protein
MVSSHASSLLRVRSSRNACVRLCRQRWITRGFAPLGISKKASSESPPASRK